jgi:hypothetical protein
MFMGGGLHKVFAAPEERNVADVKSSLRTFRPSRALGERSLSIDIRLLWSGSVWPGEPGASVADVLSRHGLL